MKKFILLLLSLFGIFSMSACSRQVEYVDREVIRYEYVDEPSYFATYFSIIYNELRPVYDYTGTKFHFYELSYYFEPTTVSDSTYTFVQYDGNYCYHEYSKDYILERNNAEYCCMCDITYTEDGKTYTVESLLIVVKKDYNLEHTEYDWDVDWEVITKSKIVKEEN